MKKSWKPEGHSTVSPYLIIPEPQKLIDFLTGVFGAVPLRRHPAPDGRIAHAEVRIGDSVIMMGDAGDGQSVESYVHVYVEDVDQTFEKAIAAGGHSVQRPVKKEDADKRGGVSDPTGAITFWIGTQLD